MSLASKLLSASGGLDKLFVDDVFSAYTYTGNGSTQTINNGIDLAGKGGLVWMKNRAAVGHALMDTSRGANNYLRTELTDASVFSAGFNFSFLSDGFSQSNGFSQTNQTSAGYASWTFRKAPKFFDIVTYTGNGVAGRQLPHALGIAPGMVVIKSTSNTSNWAANHLSLAAGNYMKLNDISSVSYSTSAFFGTHSSSSFQIGSDFDVNAAGYTYVAYLFAHDPNTTDGIIQCGSYTTDASGNVTVNLGWEPQYLMIKNTNGSAGGENWTIFDSSRPWSALPTSSNEVLQANTSAAAAGGYGSGWPIKTATGFTVSGAWTDRPFIYLAIRRPNKPPTTGTQVYNAIARTGTSSATSVAGVGFAPDLYLQIDRAQLNFNQNPLFDRLRGLKYSRAHTTDAELDLSPFVTSFDMNGLSLTNSGFNSSSATYINHFFKRAPGVFDIVAYTGSPSGNYATVSHNLTVAPELMICKGRSTAGDWWRVYHKDLPTAKFSIMRLHTTDANLVAGSQSWDVSTTAAGLSSGASDPNNTFVAYLFASKAGISKVGNYTGNGTTQTIPCGFTTGARFLLIKRTDAAGDWKIFDSVRGIVSANDPHLALNTTAAEVTTDDSVDPDVSGFVINQVAATNLNVSAGTYIFLAIA